MQRITTVDDVKSLGTILTIWAHPDDETFTAGGLLAVACANGQRVVCITATKGEAGTQNSEKWPLENIAQVREQELQAAFDILGIKEHQWLGYMDGQVNAVPLEDALAKIMPIAEEVQPDTILTFGPDGLTGHTDHIAVSGWVDEIAKRLSKPVRVLQAVNTQELYDKYFAEADKLFNIYFNIDHPNLVPAAECSVCITLPGELVRKKVQALHAMPSQYEKFLSAFSNEWAEGAFCTETFMEAKL